MTVQTTAVFRRGIVAAIDFNGERQISAMILSEPLCVEFLPIFSQSLFEAIWREGVFRTIGDSCSIEMSDYEETLLPSGKARIAINAINALSIGTHDVREFVIVLIAMLERAIQGERNVYFIL